MYGLQSMPYRLDCEVIFRNEWPEGYQSKSAGSWPLTYPEHNARGFSRSGDNASSIRGTVFSRFPGTVERVPVYVRNGPRLDYKVWSKKLGKYVWARQPIMIYKLKRVKSKIKVSKGLDLPPNRLNYSGNHVTFYGGDDGLGNGKYQGYHYQPGWIRSYTGPLWTDFLLNGGYSSIGPPPQNYLSAAPSDDISNAIAELDPKALAKLYSDVKNQKVNFAQALAERGQTAGMISDLVGRLVRAVSAARHGNLSKAAKTIFPGDSKELANDWLILQYGIKPLISDIKGAINILQDGSGAMSYDVISSRTKKFPREVIFEQLNNGGTCKTTVYRTGKATVKYKARVKVANPFSQWASETGLSDAALLGWELLPYSFVVDWLLPIGNYLQNKSAFTNLELVHLHRTQYIEEYVVFEREFITKRDNDGYLWPARSSVGFINKRVQCSRSVITNNLPSLPLPSFKDPTSLLHIANAIALLRQLRK